MPDKLPPKFYQLPDLPLVSPMGHVGLLAKQLIEYADMSAAGPLLDALADEGRREDWVELRRMLGRDLNYSLRPTSASSWSDIGYTILGLFFFDVFQMDPALNCLREIVVEGRRTRFIGQSGIVGSYGGDPYNGQVEQVTIEGPINEGDLVSANVNGSATRAEVGQTVVGRALHSVDANGGVCAVRMFPSSTSRPREATVAVANASVWRGARIVSRDLHLSADGCRLTDTRQLALEPPQPRFEPEQP